MATILHFAIGIIVLGILVIIHELGHFLMAKACGIRVISFSVGFGKVIYRKTVGDTEYRISAIPFGGYVHMKGEHPEDEQGASDDGFSSKPIWQRAAVAFAGPFANISSAILILWIILMAGFDKIEDMTIGHIIEDTPGFNAQLQSGDSLVSINGKKLKSWETFYRAFIFQDQEYSVDFIRNGFRKSTVIKNVKIDDNNMNIQSAVGVIQSFPAKIGDVKPPDFPGAKLGFMPGDIVIKVDSLNINFWYQFSDVISNYNPESGPITLTIKRQDAIKEIVATPVFDKEYKRYRLGLVMGRPDRKLIRYSPVEAFPKAFEVSWDYTTMIFKLLPKLFKMRKQLAGPVGIMQMSGEVALYSFIGLLNLIALIGINLGVLNLLPLIITDGGVIFFLIIESVRRKPLSLKTQLVLNKIAIAFFIVLFVYVTKNDILRLFTQ